MFSTNRPFSHNDYIANPGKYQHFKTATVAVDIPCTNYKAGDSVAIRRGQQPTRQGVEDRGCSTVQQVARELRTATLAAAGPLRDAARGAAQRRDERHGRRIAALAGDVQHCRQQTLHAP